tara:strand:+ start:1475 stop:1663 length:189 start_codon:yes stop_codon:yes gene_type:complete
MKINNIDDMKGASLSNLADTISQTRDANEIINGKPLMRVGYSRGISLASIPTNLFLAAYRSV